MTTNWRIKETLATLESYRDSALKEARMAESPEGQIAFQAIAGILQEGINAMKVVQNNHENYGEIL